MGLAYTEAGDRQADRALLLVHGLGGRRQHWERVMPALAERHRVIAVDLPGFGESPLPGTGRFELTDIADSLAALARSLGLTRLVFVGHSLGGPLATIFATRHPEMTERLVLVAGTVQSFQQTLSGKLRPWLMRPRTAATTVFELLCTAVPVPASLRRAIAHSPLLRRVALWPFVYGAERLAPDDAQLVLDGSGAPGVIATARALARASGWERLPVEVPVALINADHDLIAPLADLRAYPGQVDRAVVINNSGHLLMLERPGEFISALAYVLNDEGPP